MSTWPKCPQDYTTVFLNKFHGPLTKTQKFNIYRLGFELACQKLGSTCEVDPIRTRLLAAAIKIVKSDGEIK